MSPGTDDRKKDSVHRTILSRLLSGEYRFGDPVTVKTLSESIGVSRQPIMAALNRLSIEGFVTITAQVGCQVVSPSPLEISDFFLMFSRYEGLMAELAAQRRTAGEIRTMRQANRSISALLPTDDAGADYPELNHAFHTAIHKGGHSPLLMQRSQTAWTMSDFLIAQTYGFTPHLRDAASEHEAIVAAIEARDAVAARLAAERHILNVGNLVAVGLAKDVAA